MAKLRFIDSIKSLPQKLLKIQINFYDSSTIFLLIIVCKLTTVSYVQDKLNQKINDYIYYNQYQQYKMNQFYHQVEAIIHNGQPESISTFINQLNQKVGYKDPEYQCGVNLIYVVKRFVNSSMARDHKIKSNSFKCLSQIALKIQNISDLNYAKFQQFFLQASDHKKLGQGKKLQTQTYVTGKLLVISSLSSIFKDQQTIIKALIELIAEYPHFQEEIVQSLYLICKSKSNRVIFKKITLSTQKGKILLKVLTQKATQNILSQVQINEALTQAAKQYPKKSIVLKYCGTFLSKCIKVPAEFFKNKYMPYFKQQQEQQQKQEEEQSLKDLYYLLYLQKHFLSSVTISKDNLAQFLSLEMINTWLQQLRVKNRHMKQLTTSTKVKFQQNPQFSYDILQNLHEKKVYLENVSSNHPLIQLYKSVDATKYQEYLIKLAKQQVQDVQDLEQLASSKQEQYLSELQFFVRERSQDLTSQQIGQTFSLLISKSRQRKNSSQKLLNLVWSLFHALCLNKSKKKKKIILNIKGANIVSKINLQECKLESEQIALLKQAIKIVKNQVKNNPQTQNRVKMCFLNFLIALILYVVIYPEQVQVLGEMKFVQEDLQKLYVLQEKVDKVKKKVKKNQEVADPKMPIHVLVDIFISLLTKAPTFLRNAINLLFEQMIPHIQSSDLDTLLDVIQKPDQQYIQQI